MPTAADVFNDPRFQALSPADKIAVLTRIDPNFAKLSPADQQQVIGKAAPMGFQQAAPAPAAAAAPEALKAPLPGGTLRQLLRPQNWSLEGVPETFGREAGAAGSTLNPINIVKALWQESKAQAEQADKAPFSWANIRHLLEGPTSVGLDPLLRSLGALGDYRKMSLEQGLSAAPEAMGQGAGQALMMRGPINKLAGTATPEPGPLLGVLTRSKAALDRIEAAYPNAAVNPVPAFKIALRAFEASKRGYTLPKPISDFLNHMNGTQPLDFQAARDFSKALGEKIPWDQPGAKVMNGYMKQMREALEQENVNALKNDPRAGAKVADQYLKAKAEYGKGTRSVELGQKAGRVVGGYAGYELGRKLGHPLEGVAAGQYLGKHLVSPLTGGIAKQVVEPPILGRPIAATAGALSTARKAATPFAAPFTAPFQQQPQQPDEGGQ